MAQCYCSVRADVQPRERAYCMTSQYDKTTVTQITEHHSWALRVTGENYKIYRSTLWKPYLEIDFIPSTTCSQCMIPVAIWPASRIQAAIERCGRRWQSRPGHVVSEATAKVQSKVKQAVLDSLFYILSMFRTTDLHSGHAPFPISLL